MYHPSIYELNTRVWLRNFDEGNKRATLADVPNEYWKNLASLGFDYVWLMGVWEVCPSSIPKYCLGKYSIKEYSSALSDWSEEDVIGSPFAINDYQINPAIGSREDLLIIKEELNKLNMKLVLDFIPNHFSAESKLIESNPEVFLRVPKAKHEIDGETFFKDPFGREMYFAHGRDPYFPAWSDTIQVNYSSEAAREFMQKALLNVSGICDGVRCDMAMLMLSDVFNKTWGNVLSGNDSEQIATEFWEAAIANVKRSKKDFIFIAEAYWDLERVLQQLGFNYTYDKILTDLLVKGNANSIREHLAADILYQNKSVRFIENHDEARSAASLGIAKSKAASVIISTIPGMSFYHDGQFEGRKIKLPVQLARAPVEQVNHELIEHYNKLFSITRKDIFKKGKWEIQTILPSGNNDNTFNNILAWHWLLNDKRVLIVVNYSEEKSYCKIKLNVEKYNEDVVLADLLNEIKYQRSKSGIIADGLFISLNPFACHIFEY